MKVAIFGKTFDKSFHPHIIEIFNKLVEFNSNITIYKPFYEFIKSEVNLNHTINELYTSNEDFQKDSDLMISIGGDGTFLESTLIIQNLDIPIIGINSGSLGFLANISKEEISEALNTINQNNYTYDLRTLIKLETANNEFLPINYALNEITIQKQGAAMLTINTYINEELINSYISDGLIISTPTGSTAYSLSVGGPVVVPGSGNFIISPIAPHNLTVRPIIVSDCHKIRLEVYGRDSNFITSMDRRYKVFNMSSKLIVSKNDFQIKMINLESHSFYNTLRNKLMWGIDKRNN